MELTDAQLYTIWQKALIVPGVSGDLYRKDVCGAWIRRDMYGRVGKDEPKNSCRWTVDHIDPDIRDGPHLMDNLRPLQWYNNVAKGDGPLTCPIKSTEG